MKPFLKWAGGKYRLAEQITKYFPEDSQQRRLVEPFAGAGAVTLNSDFKSYWINDINPDLINIYIMLRRDVKKLINEAKLLFKTGNNREFYLDMREEFNTGDKTQHLQQAALFIYLNRHCFNGLCRYNRKGDFNVPFGKYDKVYFPECEMLEASRKIQGSKITCLPFEDVFASLEDGDVIYCDPPYINTFSNYFSGGFNLKQHEVLAKLCEGKRAFVSNTFGKTTMQIFSNADEKHILNSRRSISRSVVGRKTIEEVLLVYKKDTHLIKKSVDKEGGGVKLFVIGQHRLKEGTKNV